MVLYSIVNNLIKSIMKKLSAFIMAATLAGVVELAAAKSENHRISDKAVITTGRAVAVTDTIPTKKKKKNDPNAKTDSSKPDTTKQDPNQSKQ